MIPLSSLQSKASRFFVWILMLSLLFDIGGGFGLKYVVMTLVLTFFFVKLLSSPFPKTILVEAFLLFLFITILLVSVLRGNNFSSGASEISFLLFVVVLIVGQGSGRQFLSDMFLSVSVFAACLIVLTFVLIAVVPDPALEWAHAGQTNRLGYLGVKPGLDWVPNVYFRWSAWLVLGFSLAIFQRRFLFAALIFSASLLTMSAAIILGLVLVIFLYFVFSVRLNFRGFLFWVSSFFVVFSIFASVFVLFPEVFNYVLSKLSSDSDSTNIKLGHISSIISLMLENPSFLFFGQGPGTSFYSEGVGELVTNVEVSHFNLLRQFGVFGALVYFLYIFYVIMCLFRLGWTGYPWVVGLLVMFLVAGTNPLLLSPVFFVPLLLARLYTIENLGGNRYAEF